METKKYKLTDETKNIYGRTLYRIEALRDFSDVKKGDKGGYIEKEENLSQNGNCWVYDDAMVRGKANVYSHADIRGDAEITADTDYIVFKNWWSSGRFFTWTRSNNMWRVGCFYGTSNELIEKAQRDSNESGKECEKIVKYVESILKDNNADV